MRRVGEWIGALGCLSFFLGLCVLWPLRVSEITQVIWMVITCLLLAPGLGFHIGSDFVTTRYNPLEKPEHPAPVLREPKFRDQKWEQ